MDDCNNTVKVSLGGNSNYISVNNSQYSEISSLEMDSNSLESELKELDRVAKLLAEAESYSLDNNDNNNNNIININAAKTIIKVGGRVLDQSWSIFTNDLYPNQTNESRCKYCDVVVTHYKKSEVIKKHLLKCKNYNNILTAEANKSRPS